VVVKLLEILNMSFLMRFITSMTQRYVDVSYLADYNFDILCTFHISEKVSFKFKWAGTILGP